MMTSIIVTIIGAVVLVLISKNLEKHPISPTLIALLLGIIIGPQALNTIDLKTLGNEPQILEVAAHLTLGIGLISVALRISKEFPRRNWKLMSLFIVLSMILMWIVSTILVYFILGIPFWLAALIGAIIIPTDPIVARPIVADPGAKKILPKKIHNIISFESGANDGLSYLFIFLPFLILQKTVEKAFSHWLINTFLWEIVIATFFGIFLEISFGKLLQLAKKRNLIMEDWRLIYTVVLSFLAIYAGKLIDSDELLVTFAA